MTARNVYATLSDYNAYITASGQTASSNVTDDVVIDSLLESASRYIDSKTSRFFYPKIETRNYSIPEYPNVSMELEFKADLLEVVTFLNGDNTSIAATNYHLLPKNEYPKYKLNVKETSSFTWETDSDGESEFVLDMTAIFGYHNNYASEGWLAATTMNEALDASETAFDVVSEALFRAGQIIKFDNEIGIVSSTATSLINVVKRGDNGSTAATHLTGITVYIWQPMPDLKNATLELAHRLYKRRFGQSTGEGSIVTPSGVILPPKEIPASVNEFINKYQRRVL